MRISGEGEGLVIAGSVDANDATTSFSAARSELLSRPGPPGPGRRRALVSLTDEWLQEIYRLAQAPMTGMALVAVGGYGRGELAPGSDLDLLLLHEGAPGAVPDNIWYPIWDSRQKLDHSVRTLSEARRLATQDLKVILGLLDARCIAGDEILYEQLSSSVRSDWRAFAPKRVDELRASVDERRERAGEVAHLLEPDLKECYGGLRDITVLRGLTASWITDMPHGNVDAAAELFLNARDALHTRSGRSGDRLLMQEQDAVALALGYADSETLMRDISAAGRSVAHASDSTWYLVGRTTKRSPRRPFRRLAGRKNRVPLTDGVVLQEGEAVLAEGARPERDSGLVLRAAAAAAQNGVWLAPHAVQRLASESAPMPVPWPRSVRDSFVSLLGAGRAMLPVWEALDQAGIIARLLPEWSHIRSAPQRNPIHIFTVDRHQVETAIQASKLQRQVHRPDLLLVGALFHDIGKARPGQDHTAVGVELMKSIGPHLGFDQADTRKLIGLVEYHLLLPEMATRRDPDDPATIDVVAEAVQDLEMLNLLEALTEADAKAAGPTAWSSWRAALIKDLVARVRGALQGESSEPDLEIRPEQRALAEIGVPDILIEDGAPGEMLTVTVAAPNRVGLLASVAGVLAINRLDVRGARAFGYSAMAMSEWTVHQAFGDQPDPTRLREDLRRALAGSLDLSERLARRDSYYDAPKALLLEPRVELIANASRDATVIEVRTDDRPAALFGLATAIAECGLDVTAARADSIGSNVIDVFYLQNSVGEPLTPDEADKVCQQLRGVVGDTSG